MLRNEPHRKKSTRRKNRNFYATFINEFNYNFDIQLARQQTTESSLIKEIYFPPLLFAILYNDLDLVKAALSGNKDLLNKAALMDNINDLTPLHLAILMNLTYTKEKNQVALQKNKNILKFLFAQPLLDITPSFHIDDNSAQGLLATTPLGFTTISEGGLHTQVDDEVIGLFYQHYITYPETPLCYADYAFLASYAFRNHHDIEGLNLVEKFVKSFTLPSSFSLEDLVYILQNTVNSKHDKTGLLLEILSYYLPGILAAKEKINDKLVGSFYLIDCLYNLPDKYSAQIIPLVENCKNLLEISNFDKEELEELNMFYDFDKFDDFVDLFPQLEPYIYQIKIAIKNEIESNNALSSHFNGSSLNSIGESSNTINDKLTVNSMVEEFTSSEIDALTVNSMVEEFISSEIETNSPKTLEQKEASSNQVSNSSISSELPTDLKNQFTHSLFKERKKINNNDNNFSREEGALNAIHSIKILQRKIENARKAQFPPPRSKL